MLQNFCKNSFAGAFKGRSIIKKVFSGNYKKLFSFKRLDFFEQVWKSLLGVK